MEVGNLVEIIRGPFKGQIGTISLLLSGSPDSSVFGPGNPPDDYDFRVDFPEIKGVPFWEDEVRLVRMERSSVEKLEIIKDLLKKGHSVSLADLRVGPEKWLLNEVQEAFPTARIFLWKTLVRNRRSTTI